MNNVVESVNVGDDDKQIKATSSGSMKDVEKLCELTESSGNNEKPTVAEPITIDLDETSCEEVLEQTQAISVTNDRASIEAPLQTKATEFVIVSTTSIDCGNKMSDVKDELADPITSEDVFENDPMGILTELNDRSISSRSVDQEEAADDSSTGSSVHTISSSSNIMEWSKEHPWLLYEESDEMYGYCLYCDVKLSVRSLSSVKQHGISLYHKERSDNYLAFREEEERNNLGTPLFEIKQEFGTDSYISALKLKRKTQAEALNNYNWRRWLEECPWLERDNNAGTVGRCKYCGIRINVEFSYLRTRHQETGKHKEFEKTHNNITPDQRSADDEAEDAQHNSKTNERYRWGEPVEDQHATLRCKICDTKVAKNNFLRHLRTISHLQNEEKYLNSLKSKRPKRKKEITNLENTEGISPKTPPTWDMYAKQHPWLIADPTDVSYAFCKYCEKRVLYGNSAAKRATHENSMQHKNQEKLYRGKKRKGKTVEETTVEGNTGEDVDDESEEEDDEEEKREDEDNPRDEENNTQRKDEGNDDGEESKTNEESEEDEADDDGAEEDEDEAEEEDDEAEEEDDEAEEDEDEAEEDEDEAEENDAEEGDEEKEVEDEVDEEGDTVHQGKNGKQGFAAEDQNESKKRITRNNPKWYDQYPWCKKYKADPVNYCFCSYCKIVISKTCNRIKHSKTGRHRAAEAEFLRRQSKKKSLHRSKIPEDSFEWAVDIKSQPNLYYCKYCRVRISRRYSRKQHSVSKIHQINANLFKANRRKLVKPEPSVEASAYSQQRSESSSLAKDAAKVPSFITLVKQWQKKFSWLTYKRIEVRSNYAFCKVCEQSLYIRSIKNVIKHQRSGKHVRTANQLRRQKLQQEREQEEFHNTQEVRKRPKREVEPSTSSHLEILKKQRTEESNRISKESSKGSTSKSSLVEMQKRFSWIEKSKKPDYAHCRYCDDDIYLKILFLRNHSNSQKHRQAVIKFRVVSTKREKRRHSESNAENEDDDDIVLVEDNAEEVLISEQDDNWTVKSENMDEHEALDYLLQRSGKTAENNVSHRHTSATEDRSKRAKRSQSLRRLNDNNASLVASILSTPLTLASCLGPLIQQQIQQQVANPLTAATTTATPPAAPTVLEAENSYDLFFKSVSETMKKLPTDLAAEGKVKVMQVICDLELKALKRKNLQTNIEKEPTENTVTVNSSANANSTRPGEGTEASASGMVDMETVITPLYTGVDTSPVSNPHQKVAVSSVVSTPSISITSTDGNKEKGLNPNQSPIIGVMDKNGLHTLHFKNSAVVKQVPKTNVAPNNSPAMSSSSIRCIPFKNLTQNVSTEGNTKITRIQMPITNASPSTPATAPTHTSQTPQSTSNMNATNTPKGMLNLRSIHITKRSAPQTTAVSPVVTTSVSDKNPQGTYITTNVQRWTPVNGVSPTGNIKKQTSNPNFQLSAKQSSTPIGRNYQ